MKRLGKSFEPHIYPKTTHSFVLFQDIAAFLQSFDYRLINIYDGVYHGRELQWGDAVFASPRLGSLP